MLGVEPIALSPNYFAAKSRSASALAVRDECLKAEIIRLWKENCEVYRAGKVWLELNRQGISVARCTVEQMTRDLAIQGVRQGGKIRTQARARTARIAVAMAVI